MVISYFFCTGVYMKEQRALTDGKKDEVHELATVVTEGLQQPLPSYFSESNRERASLQVT